MTARNLVFWVSILAGLAFSSNGQGQVHLSTSETTPSSNTAHFTESCNDLPERFRLYMSFPTGQTSLSSGEYPQVVRTFAWWAKKVLKPEYVPNETFIAANIRLFPATKERREDAAFLSYKENGIDYLMVQTGGWNGRIYFITARTDGLNIENVNDAKNVLSAELAKYVNIPAGLEIPMFDVRKQGAIYSLDARYSKTTRHVLAYAECILSQYEVGFSFKKTLFDETPSAHEPSADEWFRWEKQKKR